MRALITEFTANVLYIICFKFEAGAKTRFLLRAGQKIRALLVDLW